jgi:hypothetical protein
MAIPASRLGCTSRVVRRTQRRLSATVFAGRVAITGALFGCGDGVGRPLVAVAEESAESSGGAGGMPAEASGGSAGAGVGYCDSVANWPATGLEDEV